MLSILFSPVVTSAFIHADRAQNPGEVAVWVGPDEVMGEKVTAAVVAVPGPDPTIDEIKAFCRDKLARYKIPEYVLFIPSLPKDLGGKVMKGELLADFLPKIKNP